MVWFKRVESRGKADKMTESIYDDRVFVVSLIVNLVTVCCSSRKIRRTTYSFFSMLVPSNINNDNDL